VLDAEVQVVSREQQVAESRLQHVDDAAGDGHEGLGAELARGHLQRLVGLVLAVVPAGVCHPAKLDLLTLTAPLVQLALQGQAHAGQSVLPSLSRLLCQRLLALHDLVQQTLDLSRVRASGLLLLQAHQ